MEKEIEQTLASRFPEANTLKDIALKLGEEAGEVQGAVVKLDEGRASWSDLEDEIGDVLIVLSRIAARRGTTLEALREIRWATIKGRGVAGDRCPCNGLLLLDGWCPHMETGGPVNVHRRIRWQKLNEIPPELCQYLEISSAEEK